MYIIYKVAICDDGGRGAVKLRGGYTEDEQTGGSLSGVRSKE